MVSIRRWHGLVSVNVECLAKDRFSYGGDIYEARKFETTSKESRQKTIYHAYETLISTTIIKTSVALHLFTVHIRRICNHIDAITHGHCCGHPIMLCTQR